MKNNAHKDKGGEPPACYSGLDPESRFYPPTINEAIPPRFAE